MAMTHWDTMQQPLTDTSWPEGLSFIDSGGTLARRARAGHLFGPVPHLLGLLGGALRERT